MQISFLGACAFLIPLIRVGVRADTTEAQDALTCVTLSAPLSAYQVETITTTKSNGGSVEHITTTTDTISVTAPPVTVTVVESSTITSTVTGNGSKGTFTTTVLATSTLTSTSIITGSTTATSTTTIVYTPTGTISTFSGFVAVQSSLPGLTNDKPGAKPPRRLSRRGKQCKPKKPIPEITSSAPSYYYNTTSSIKSAGTKTSCILPDVTSPSYPSKVICEEPGSVTTTTTLISTAEPITALIPGSTITKTSITTITSTATVGGTAVSTTITTSSLVSTITTVVSTSLSTTTVTATLSVNAPAVTAYAACQNPANYASYFNGYSLSTVTGNDLDLDLVQQPGTDYTACCNSCQATANCAMFALRVADKACFFLTATNTCTSPGQYQLAAHYDQTLASPNFVVGNGKCAQINSSIDDTPKPKTTPRRLKISQ